MQYQAAMAKLAADQAKAEQRFAMAIATERAKSDPTVKALASIVDQLKKHKGELNRAEHGYYNQKRGVWTILPLADKIDEVRAKLARMEFTLANLDTLPAVVDSAIARANALITLAVQGEKVTVPTDLIPEALREGSIVEPEAAFIASEHGQGLDEMTGEPDEFATE